jgi:hypothetical protein
MALTPLLQALLGHQKYQRQTLKLILLQSGEEKKLSRLAPGP